VIDFLVIWFWLLSFSAISFAMIRGARRISR